MSNLLTKKVRTELYRIVLYQLLFIIGFFVLVFLFKGLQNSISLLSGSASYWLTSALFIWGVSRFTGANHSGRFIAAFFLGESAKLMLSGVLFIMLMRFLQVNLLYALGGLAVAIIAFWAASFLSLSRGQAA
jgi:ATP synthase protein I